MAWMFLDRGLYLLVFLQYELNTLLLKCMGRDGDVHHGYGECFEDRIMQVVILEAMEMGVKLDGTGLGEELGDAWVGMSVEALGGLML